MVSKRHMTRKQAITGSILRKFITRTEALAVSERVPSIMPSVTDRAA